MTRVVHFVSHLGVGGTEAVILDHCRYRNRTDFEYVVACRDESPSVFADELRTVGVPVVVGPEACRAAVNSADLVNLHWWGYSKPLLATVRHRPFVTTLHWQAILPHIPALTISTSEYVRRIQPRPERFVAIPNGIDLERFTPSPRPQRKRIVVTRVCRPPKCAIYFWDAVHRLLARYPQLEVRIVGNREGAQHPSPRVRFLGVRRDIPEILRDTDIFLYTPSPEIGTKDLVVMEASACGVPCVVSDVSVVRESVEHGRNGFLTPFGDVDAVVESVARLIEQPELRAQMGRNAAEMARRQFDVRRNVERYEAVYRGVLAGYRQGHAGIH